MLHNGRSDSRITALFMSYGDNCKTVLVKKGKKEHCKNCQREAYDVSKAISVHFNNNTQVRSQDFSWGGGGGVRLGSEDTNL